MKRKLIKVGTSAAVIIPKDLLMEQGVKIGDTVDIEISKTTKKSSAKNIIDPKVIQWTDEFIKEYRPLLNKLAKS